MEITPKNTVNIDAYVNQVQQKQNDEQQAEKAAQQTTKRDTVELSDTARRIQEASKDLGSIPEVREDRVAELKNQIEKGAYHPDPEKVAGAMIIDALSSDYEE